MSFLSDIDEKIEEYNRYIDEYPELKLLMKLFVAELRVLKNKYVKELKEVKQ